MKIPSTVPEIPSTPICRPGGVLKISQCLSFLEVKNEIGDHDLYLRVMGGNLEFLFLNTSSIIIYPSKYMSNTYTRYWMWSFISDHDLLFKISCGMFGFSFLNDNPHQFINILVIFISAVWRIRINKQETQFMCFKFLSQCKNRNFLTNIIQQNIILTKTM